MRASRLGAWVATLPFAWFAVACSYPNARVDLRALESSGVYVANAPKLTEGARSYGEVEINQRAFYFSSCSQTAEAALQRLRREALARGGNLIAKVEFRHRKNWSTNPKCRRNFTWALLIVPMFLPVPESVRVRGEAIYEPAAADLDRSR